MDVQMPVMDGLEATRPLRASGLTASSLPVLALTANAYFDDIVECLDAGMQAHLAKPIRLNELDAALQRWAAVSTPMVADARERFSPRILDRYRARKTETLRSLEALVRTDPFEDSELTEMASMLHKLAGTAEMFGDGALGLEARALEHGIGKWPISERDALIRHGAALVKCAA